MVEKLKELFVFRELLLNLIKRELKVKYKKSILGFFWSLLNPILTTIVFTFVFAVLLRIQPPVLRYGTIFSFPVFLLCALLPWNFLSISLSLSINSIVGNGNLVKKVYFPREILPSSTVLANLINFCLELLVLFMLLTFLGSRFFIYLPLLIAITIIQTLFTIGMCLIFSCLNVYFRDIQHLLGIILMIWFYATPIIYPFEYVLQMSHKLPWLPFAYKLNPMATFVLAYRSILYDCQPPSFFLLGYAVVVSLLTLYFGYLFFNTYEPTFAEEI
ncbi:MAG: ABC transporter permease [Actinomycetota bacterium]